MSTEQLSRGTSEFPLEEAQYKSVRASLVCLSQLVKGTKARIKQQLEMQAGRQEEGR